MGFFNKLKEGLLKTKQKISEKLDNVFLNFKQVDKEFLENLEETLILSDIGPRLSEEIIKDLKEIVLKKNLKEKDEIISELKNILINIININTRDNYLKKVILVIGVNGAGKTTTIGKLAHLFKAKDEKVLVVGADTFRAAAFEQLETLAKRAQVDIILGKENEDPASVVYRAIEKYNEYDRIIIDTAGRLHNKINLMKKKKKIQNILLKKEIETETLLVLDGTTGQNALIQAEEFSKVANISGYIMTKLDGSTKGGIIFQIIKKTEKPLKFVGLGEKINDIIYFDPHDFVDAII